jgi:hypothetical protein
MGTREIPKSYKHVCDRCRREVISEEWDTPLKWQVVEPSLRPDHEHTLLCPPCVEDLASVLAQFWRDE